MTKRQTAGGMLQVRGPAFVGRERELASLASALAGEPGVILVEGEAGIGKTRLVREFFASPAAAGAEVLVATCPAFRQPLTLGPLVDALRQTTGDVAGLGLSALAGALRPLFPEWAGGLPPAPERLEDATAARHRLFGALAELLARLSVSVLVAEDVHWADDVTLEFLLFLAARQPQAPTLVVTYRPEDIPDGSLLRRMSSRLPSGGRPERIILGPLDVAETARLVSSMLDDEPVSAAFAEFLNTRTEGLPLAVEESVLLMYERADLIRQTASGCVTRWTRSTCPPRSETLCWNGPGGWAAQPGPYCEPRLCSPSPPPRKRWPRSAGSPSRGRGLAWIGRWPVGCLLRSRDRAGAEQELWALLAVCQALRMAMTTAAESAGADPDRASFTTALETARDQVTAARGVTGPADPGGTGRIGRAVLADLLPARRPRYSARKVKCSTSRYHARDCGHDQDRSCQSVTITRVQITIQIPPPDRPAARPRGRKGQPPGPRQPRPGTRRDQVTCTMASQPGHHWAGHDLATQLGIKPRNMLTQLAEWAHLGFLAKTGPGGMRSPRPSQHHSRCRTVTHQQPDNA